MDYSTVKMFESHARAAKEAARIDLRKKHAEELKSFDAGKILKWDSKSLAEWQSQFESDEPQWVLADQEWKRRAGISTRRIAIAAIVVSVLSLLVSVLGYWHSVNDATPKQEKQFGQPEK